MSFEQLEKQKSPELMSMPEVKTEVNQGYFWYTFLQKATNPNWEQLSGEHKFSKELDEYFDKHKLDKELKQKWQEIITKISNDEILFWFSLAANNPELEESVFEEIEKYKDFKKEEAKELFQEFKSVINEFKEKHSDIWHLLEPHLKEDLEKRKKSTEEKEIIQDCLDYFKPKKETSDIQEVNYLPTNFLIKTTKGSGFKAKNKGIIISHIDNSSSKRHEFLHFIINPITEKMNLSPAQEKKIVAMASRKLVIDQKYGEHPKSLLNESLIRVYCGLVENKPLMNLENFKKLVDKLDAEQFKKIKREKKENFDKMGIKNLEDLKSKAEEYFEKNLKDELAEKVYQLYQNFNQEKQRNPNLTFEDYFLESYEKVLGL